MEDHKFDVIICGTGIKECLLSTLLAQNGKKVLHIDRYINYGGQSATLNFTELWLKFKGSQPLPNYYDSKQRNHWNIDLIQKFTLSNGNLVKILRKVRVDKYLEWKIIDETQIFQQRQDGCFMSGTSRLEKVYSTDYQVPCTQKDILKSHLMGLFEKRRYLKFLDFLQQFDPQDKATYNKLPLKELTFQEVMSSFGLENNTIEFIGHVFGQYDNDMFYQQPALKVLERIQYYQNSVGVYSDNAFIYPIYGNMEICQATARIIAVYGSTLMLDFNISEFLFNENGKVSGIIPSFDTIKRVNIEQIACDFVIADPSYIFNTKLASKIQLVGHSIRCICILNESTQNTKQASRLVVIPGSHVGRYSDIYITFLNSTFQICEKGFIVCQIHTNAETQNPEQELQPAFQIIGDILEKFIYITDNYEPVQQFQDNLFITSNYNSSPQFEQDLDQIFQIFKYITGKEMDLNNLDKDNLY